ncbi:MAG: ribonuclease HI [Spirochaetaceae bacterium]|nr:ribonuclease HI [Spirochaetaceae bacterium]
MTIQIYCDGACSGNPGPGGWAAIIVNGTNEEELSGGHLLTTNNQMELTAAINGLQFAANNYSESGCSITTDSQYVKNGITSWINNWRRNGWRTADKKPVKNRELWQKLDELNAQIKPTWQWVKGHSGHHYNERCDKLATAAAKAIT